MLKKQYPFLLSALLLSFSAHAATQGEVVETCIYGEGEAKITVVIHKGVKKGAPRTADVFHGTTFRRLNMKLERTPTEPIPDFSFQSLPQSEEYAFHVSYGPTLQASMDYSERSNTFQTNEMVCHGLESSR